MTYIDSEVGWAQMKLELAALLDALAPGGSIVLDVRGRAQFVRATGSRRRGVRTEAASNRCLPPRERIDLEALDLLEHLGWHPPTHFLDHRDPTDDGSAHHFIDWGPGWTGAEVASLLVRTLRGAYEVDRADDLAYVVAEGATSPARGSATSPLGELIDELVEGFDVVDEVVGAVSGLTAILSVAPVPHTDRVVRILADGGLTVFVDVANQLVRATIALLPGFPLTAPSLAALLDCSRPMRFGRLEFRESTVCALVDLPTFDGIGPLLARQLDSVFASLDGLRATLRPHVAQASGGAPAEPLA